MVVTRIAEKIAEEVEFFLSLPVHTALVPIEEEYFDDWTSTLARYLRLSQIRIIQVSN